MVSKEDGQEVKSPQEGEKPPQEDPGTEKKEEVTGENKQKTEGKKQQGVAFPLGGSPRVPSVKTGSSSMDEKKTENLPNPLEKTDQVSSEQKEDMMPLDEESKKFIGEEVKSQIEPVNKKLSVLDEVKTGMDALREVVEKINTTTPPTPQVKVPTVQELIEGTKKAIKSEEDERRKRLEDDQRTKDREEKLNKVFNWCFSHPEATECKTLPDYLKKQLEEALKKVPQGTEKKKTEVATGLQPLPPMTEEKRKALTEEENKVRDSLVGEKLKAQNITSNDIFRQFDETDLDNIRKKPTMRDPIVEALTPDELAKAVGIRCTDEACQVKFREGGIAVLQKDKDGRWNVVDKEVAKEMKPLF